MQKALSVAKTQSVKEINKRADFKKLSKLISIVVIIILVIAMIGFLAYNYFKDSNYKYKETLENISFYSNDLPITDALFSLGTDENIALVFNILINDSNSISNITESLIYLSSIFPAKKKHTTIIINSVDKENKLYGCHSNLGNIKGISKDFNYSQCLELLSYDQTYVISDYIDSTRNKTTVLIDVKTKKITIKAKSKEELNKALIIITRNMYDDIDAIMNAINAFKENLANSFDGNVIKGNTLQDKNSSN
ncbi:MAG: hypothetical protein V1824_03610 [archaeon]